MTPADRPRVVLAMAPGLEQAVLHGANRDRFTAVADLLDDVPVTSWDDPRADALLGEATVIATHWMAPEITADVLDRAPGVALVAHGAGTVKGIVTRDVLARGVTVTSANDANAVPVAEYTLAMILLTNKLVLAQRDWLRGVPPPADVLERSRRAGNWGKRIGVVGASSVGRHLLALLRPFRLRPLLYDPFVDAEAAAALGAEKVEDLDELCARSHVLTLHVPDVASTHHMIGAAQLAALRDGATVINTARAAVIDQEALMAELRTGRIDAVLDVTDPDPLPAGHELLELPNVVVTPHVAGSQGTELARLADSQLTELERFAAGRPPRFPVTLEAWDRTA